MTRTSTRSTPPLRDTGISRRCRSSRAGPQENGKQERSGGYVKDNALQGPPLRQSRGAQRPSPALESDDRAAAHPRHDAPPGLDPLRRGRARGAAPARRRRPFRSSAAASAPCIRTATSRSTAATIPCPRGCSARSCACNGTPSWCVSITATRSSSCTRACPPATTRRMPGQRTPEATTRQQAFIAAIAGALRARRRAVAPMGGRGARRPRRARDPAHSRRARPDPETLPREAVLRAATTALTHRLFRYKQLARLATQAAPAQPSLPL